MGRVTHQPVINHPSHPQHPLRLSGDPTQAGAASLLAPAQCAGCDFRATGWVYSCDECKFHLHVTCAQLATQVQHPCHPAHALALLYTPAYPEGSFHCDACGHPGTSFSYHCNPCGVDLHALCASMPLTLQCTKHAHPLALAFSSAYANSSFSCDVCGNIGSTENQWLYRCSVGCDFDSHLGCATRNVGPAPAAVNYQVAARGLPAQQAVVRQPQVMGVQQQQLRQPMVGQAPALRPLGYPPYPQPQPRPARQLSGGFQSQQQPAGGLVNQFCNAAAQQLGQSLVQGILGGVGVGGGGGGNGGTGADGGPTAVVYEYNVETNVDVSFGDGGGD